MNFIEIKIFQHTVESREFNRLNEKEITPCGLFKITQAYLDFDRIVSFHPHSNDDNVTNLDMIGGPGYMVPMKYQKFKEFFNSKIQINI